MSELKIKGTRVRLDRQGTCIGIMYTNDVPHISLYLVPTQWIILNEFEILYYS